MKTDPFGSASLALKRLFSPKAQVADY